MKNLLTSVLILISVISKGQDSIMHYRHLQVDSLGAVMSIFDRVIVDGRRVAIFNEMDSSITVLDSAKAIKQLFIEYKAKAERLNQMILLQSYLYDCLHAMSYESKESFEKKLKRFQDYKTRFNL